MASLHLLRRRSQHLTMSVVVAVSLSLLLCGLQVSTTLAFVLPSLHPIHTKASSPVPRKEWNQDPVTLRVHLSNGDAPDDKVSASIITTPTGASIPNLTTSLVKSIVGGGVLALPAGVAALGDSPNVLPVAFALIVMTGGINAYFFALLGRVCSQTGATGYREAWERTVGPESSQAVAIAVALKTALSCLAYSMILADSFQSLAVAAGMVDVSRNEALLGITLVALLPLCLLRDLSSLAPFSLAGIAVLGFTGTAMTIRHADGSYAPPTGAFLQDLPETLQPVFGDSGPDVQGVVLACTLATAFVAHYNAPRFHSELQDNTVERFNTVVLISFTISALAFMVVASQGFLTFGANAQGFILNNYSPYDPLLTASRAAVALSIVLTFPLPFVGFRDGILDVLQVPQNERTDTAITTLSVGLLLAVTVAAALVQDLALVLSVGGGTFSTAVASVFPALMFRAAVEKNDSSSDSRRNDELDAKIGLVLMWVCIAIGATGVSIALQKAFG